MTILRPLTIPLFVGLLTGCGGTSDSDDPISLSPPLFNLAISDAPVDGMSQGVVCFNQVQLKRNEAQGGDLNFTIGLDGGTLSANDLCRDENGDVITDTAGINLLDYQGANAVSLLEGVSIDAGTYSQLRLQLSPGSYAIDAETGDALSVTVPSNELKLDGFTAALGNTLNFTLEFDLRQAMTNPMGREGYILKPRGVRLVDNNQVGHINGSVDEALLVDNQCRVAPVDISTPIGAVYLYQGTDIALTAMADNGGSEDQQPFTSVGVFYDGAQDYAFAAGYLPAGDYSIAFTCDTQDEPELDDDITLLTRQNVSVAGSLATTEVHISAQ